MRTTSVSFLLLLLGAVGACSSKSTDSGSPGTNNGGSSTSSGGSAQGGSATGTGGNGSIIGAGNAGSATAGTSAAAGGTGTNPDAQACADAPVVCLDDDTASTCNPDTLMEESITCSTGVASLGPGLISQGCISDAEGSGCSFDFEDEACEKGAPAYAACSRAAGFPIEDLEAYFACFTNEQDSKAFIPCFADFVDQAAKRVACKDAEEACFAAAGGAGGAGG